MKINYLKINGFGKLKEKEIELDEKINLVYGNNEAGKTTLLKFILAMLYGANKNKNGKDISVFDKYKPWNDSEFSGKIKYTLDNNETFEVYREFSKKNPKIYNKNLEDITNNFNNDKTKGINFLYEQTKVDEDLFLNTSIVDQEDIKLSKSAQNDIIQKISNAISTRDDNISYKRSIEKINKKLNLEVGTERTSERPINIINDEINNLKNKKSLLEEYKTKKSHIESEKNIINKEIEINESKNELLKRIKNVFEKYKINYAEINLDKNVKEEAEEKINKLNEEIIELKKEEKSNEKKSKNIFFIIFILMIIVTTASFIFNFGNILNLLFCSIAVISLILSIYKKLKFKNIEKRRINRINEKRERIENEIKIIEENKNNKLEEIKKTGEKLLLEKAEDKNEIIKEFSNRISLIEIEKLFDLTYEELLIKLEKDNEYINELKLEKNTMEIENKNINAELENLSQIEEKLEDLYIQKQALISLSKSINLAKECLEQAYMQMKEKINPEFIKNLSRLVEKISNGKYKNINFNDIDGLQVELQNGNYILADRLSTGTITQMYLALRVCVLKEITDENMPIILDESLVYCDNERLESILKYFSENYSNQIIIFSCSKREKEILNKLNINYKLVEI